MSIRVTARHGEHAERFLVRFKRTCSRSGLFREIKRRRFYEKPSQKRRRKKKETERANLKARLRQQRARERRRRGG